MSIQENPQLEENIALWEPSGEGVEVIRTVDITDCTVQRIVKVTTPNPFDEGVTVEYFWYRYFEMQFAGLTTVVCSVDHNGVDADRIIQELAELIG